MSASILRFRRRQAAVILDFFGFENQRFDGTAAVAKGVSRGILFFRSGRNFWLGVTHAEPILEWGKCGRF
jgi:hypothetical protein